MTSNRLSWFFNHNLLVSITSQAFSRNSLPRIEGNTTLRLNQGARIQFYEFQNVEKIPTTSVTKAGLEDWVKKGL
jgi:hypothetical protein